MKNKIKIFSVFLFLFFPEIILAQFNQGSSMMGPAVGFDLIAKILGWIFGGMGALSILGIFISAVMYLAAASDEDKIKAAGGVFGTSLVGVIISILGIVAVNLAMRYSGQ